MKKIVSLIAASAMLLSYTSNVWADDEVLDEVIAENEVIEEIYDNETEEEYYEEDADNDIELFAQAKVFDGGDGSADNPFLISNEDQLALINDFPSNSFKLLNDIELVQKWNYIGYNGDDFSGVFDGGGHTISNITVRFVQNNKGTIKNVYFDNTDSERKPTIAVIAYNNYDTIENCHVKGTVSYNNTTYSSGCVAYNQPEAIIRNCSFTGNVNVATTDKDKAYSSGFTYSNSGTIENCYMEGTVKTDLTYTTSYDNSYAYADGFCYENKGDIKNCYSKCTILCTNTNTRKTSGAYIFKNGFCCNNSGNIENCYYDRQISECTDENKGTPKNTLAMKMQVTYNNWDFENIWGIDENINDGYPYLLSEYENINGTDEPIIPTEEPIINDDEIKVTEIILDKSDAGITIGETISLSASVAPDNAVNKSIKWSSANTKIATVSDNGVVTGISEGTAQIYARSASNSSVYAICNVTVAKQKIAVTGIEFADNLFNTPYEVNIGKTLTLSPTVKPADATNKEIKWNSSDADIAKVVNGKVTGISEGTATITATTADGGFTASVTVNVTKPTIHVTGIALNAEQMTVNVKESKKLLATVTPTDADEKGITFKSNNNAIATVDADGTVTGIAPGTTLIQAISDTSSGKFIAFCTVTVPKPIIEVTSLKLDKSSLEIVEGKTVPLKTILKPSNATYQTITWSTADEAVATVSQDGYVTAHGVGETVVSATSVNGISVLCNVTVLSSDTPAQLKVEDATVKAGKQVPITVSIASNPGITTFNFDLTYDHTKLYPVSYTKGDALSNVNVVTPLSSQSFAAKDSVRFLCSTADSKNMDTDGELITVVFQTLSNAEYGEETIGIVPIAFTNQYYEAINLREDNCKLNITDYIIGDVNNDDVVDLKDSMVLGQYIAGFDIELTEQGKKAAIAIYPDNGDNLETAEPTINDFQHLFRYLSDWQVELGKK